MPSPERPFCNSSLTALIIIACLFLVPITSFAQRHRNANPPTRIRFTTGAISAQVPGSFSPAHERPRFVIKARKGDHMVVNIIPVTRGLTMAGTVGFPSGQGDGGPGGIVMNADLDESVTTGSK